MTLIELAEKLRPIIEQAMQNVDDSTATEAPTLFKHWVVGETLAPGDRRYYPPTGKLYKVREGQGHTTQKNWAPDLAPALWAIVTKDQSGLYDDPIDAARGMEYVYGLYYRDPEDNKIYFCSRNNETGTITLQYLPHELIGHYFEEIST